MNFIEATYILRSKKDKGENYLDICIKKISIFNSKIAVDRKYIPEITERDIFFDENRKIYEYIFKIRYPIVLFEHNISSILSVLQKVVYCGYEDEIVLVNIDLPSCYIDHFSGPGYGIEGIKRILNIEHKPVLAGYISPFVGIGSDRYVDIFNELALNGLDILLEDTSFIDDRLVPFHKRVEICLRRCEDIERETGRKIVYIPVLTGSVGEVFEKARFAESIGVHGFHIDIDPYGLELVRSLSEATEGLIAVSGGIFNSKQIEGAVLGRLLRLAGVDILSISSPFNENRYMLSRVYEIVKVLTDRWESILPVFPMLSGFVKPFDIPDIHKEFGNQVVINIQDSYYNHPEGISAGVTAIKKALDCIVKGISLEECRKHSKELDMAFSKWGKY